MGVQKAQVKLCRTPVNKKTSNFLLNLKLKKHIVVSKKGQKMLQKVQKRKILEQIILNRLVWIHLKRASNAVLWTIFDLDCR